MKRFIRYPHLPLAISGLIIILSFQNCAQNYGIVAKTDPTRAFEQGFEDTSGVALKNERNEKLIEYFALKFRIKNKT